MKKLTLALLALALVAVPGCSLSTDFDGYYTADSSADADGGSRDGGSMDGDVEDASRDAQTLDVVDLDAPSGNVLTIELEGEGGGTVISSDGMIDCGSTCSASYEDGAMVTLTVTPDENSTFVGWSEPSCDDAELTCEVTMDMALTIQVRLDLRQVRLDVTTSGDGSGGVTSSDGAITCDGSATQVCSTTLTVGTEITLTATATGTSVFAGWSGGGCTGTDPCTFTITEDTTVGASFDLDRRSLTVTLAGTGSGSVTSSPAGIECGADCSEPYDVGTMVTLTAVASSDSTFTGWSGACTGTAACTVTMDAARAVTATFTLRRYTIEIERGGTGSGTVLSNNPLGLINCGATCSAMVDHGTLVQIQATAGVGSTFGGWSGGGCDPATPICLVTVTSDTTIGASFALDQHTVSVSYASGGDGSGTVTSTPAGVSCATGAATGCVGTFDYDTDVTLTASPAVGSEFVQWSGACGGTATTCVVTTTADRAVTAEMRRRRYTVSVTRSGDGTGTVSGTGISCGADCEGEVAHGDSITLTATPAAGSTFAGWGGACASAGSSAMCTIPITEITAVSATFTLGTNVLTVTRVGSGTVTSSPSGIDCGGACAASFTTGTSITLTATPATGYTFSGWSGACSGTSTCAVTMGATPIAVTATFVPMRFTLSVSRTGTGDGSVSSSPSGITCPPAATCSAEYDYGTMVTLTAAPSTGSTFTGWSGAPSGTCTGAGPCTVTMTQARAISAAFALNTYLLDVVREGGGSGSVSSSPTGISCGTDCSQSYGHGSTIRLTATPSTGSNFAGWTGGGCGTTSPCDVTLTAATTVRARFELNRYTLQVTKVGMGTVTASDGSIDCGTTCSAQYDHGASVTLSAVAAPGYRFGGWSGAGCTGTGTCVVPMTAARSVTATFIERVAVIVMPSDPVGGRNPVVTSDVGNIRCFANGSSTGCSDTFDAGTTITLTASPPGWAEFNGWTGPPGCGTSLGPCTFTVTATTTVSARFAVLGNVAFVTSSVHTGDFGGLAAADTICDTLARDAGLPDASYVAWLSTQSVNAGAAARGITGRNGFVRTDGLPVAYQGSDLTSGGLRHPILLDENGANVGPPNLAWTGTEPDGTVGGIADTCNDWTSATSSSWGIAGHVERGGGEWTGAQVGTVVSCNVARRLYCFGTAGTYTARTPVSPGTGAGFVFVSSMTFDGDDGVAAMDSACRSEASTRGFASATQYVAFVSTPSQSAASRVTYAGPFYRPDFWLVGDANQLLMGMPRLSTFVTQYANGTFTPNRPGWDPFVVWTGFNNGSPGGAANNATTCAGWTSTTTASTGQRGAPAATAYNRWGQAEAPGAFCGNRYPVYCIRGQ